MLGVPEVWAVWPRAISRSTCKVTTENRRRPRIRCDMVMFVAHQMKLERDEVSSVAMNVLEH